jgi:hypothetical protein
VQPVDLPPIPINIKLHRNQTGTRTNHKIHIRQGIYFIGLLLTFMGDNANDGCTIYTFIQFWTIDDVPHLVKHLVCAAIKLSEYYTLSYTVVYNIHYQQTTLQLVRIICFLKMIFHQIWKLLH